MNYTKQQPKRANVVCGISLDLDRLWLKLHLKPHRLSILAK